MEVLRSTQHNLVQVFINGPLAVSIFFVLSGRVLTASIMRQRHSLSQKTLTSFASSVIMRPLRLGVPVLAAALLATWVAQATDFQAARAAMPALRRSWLKLDSYKTAAELSPMNWFRWVRHLLVKNDMDADVWYVPAGVVWTIGYEYLGSNMLYLVTLALLRLDWRRYLVLVFLVVYLGRAVNMYHPFFVGLLFLDLDVSGYMAKMREWRFSFLVKMLLLLVIYMMLACRSISESVDKLAVPETWTVFTVSINVASAAIILLLELSPLCQRLFSCAPARFLGKISFGLYLTHGLILETACMSIMLDMSRGPDGKLPRMPNFPKNVALATMFLFYIPAITLSGYLFYRLVDDPTVRLAKWLFIKVFIDQWPSPRELVKMKTLAVVAAVLAILTAVFWPTVDEYVSLLAPNLRERTRLRDIGLDKCEPLSASFGLEGCEDIVVLGDYAYLACANVTTRMSYFPAIGINKHDNVEPRDRAYVYDFNTGVASQLQVRGIKDSFTFAGMAVHAGAKPGTVALTYVNHRKVGGSCIEVFEHQVGSLEMSHKETVCDPLIHNPNNLASISNTGRSFYVSNFLSKDTSKLQRLAEQLLRIPVADVALRTEAKEGGSVRIVTDKLNAANGVAVSPNGKTVYVVETMGLTVVLYDRQADNSLRFKEKIKLDFLPDNVNVIGDTGDLLVTGHSSAIGFLMWEQSNYTRPSPTVVVKISNNTSNERFYGKKWLVEKIFSDSVGTMMTGGTVAAAHPATKQMLIGGIFHPAVLLCKNSF
ncbi:hypothetical protein RI367_001614 [Sorochytrium milnesiophthora]